jgi:hypothetical protein
MTIREHRRRSIRPVVKAVAEDLVTRPALAHRSAAAQESSLAARAGDNILGRDLLTAVSGTSPACTGSPRRAEKEMKDGKVTPA